MRKGVCVAAFMIAAMTLTYSVNGFCDSGLKSRTRKGLPQSQCATV
jgi:hypothetical protein